VPHGRGNVLLSNVLGGDWSSMIYVACQATI